MKGQAALFPPDPPRLTDRQAFALEQIRAADGLAADELGARMHARRNKHHAGARCEWCSEEGRQVAHELRAKGLVSRKKTGLWVARRYSWRREYPPSG